MGLLHRQLRLRRFQLTFVYSPHLGDPALARGVAACLRSAERAQVKIVDPAFAKRCGERCLGEARTSRGGHGANVDQELDRGGGKLRQELVDRLAFISDRGELPSRHRSAVTTILDTMHRQ
jgi:hypothetical protein